MPRFIAVHTIPDYNEENWIEMAKGYAGWISKFPHGVSYNLTYCGFADSKFFCEWEAPDKEIIEQLFKEAGLPFDAIYPVKLWNVARMAFED